MSVYLPYQTLPSRPGNPGSKKRIDFYFPWRCYPTAGKWSQPRNLCAPIASKRKIKTIYLLYAVKLEEFRICVVLACIHYGGSINLSYYMIAGLTAPSMPPLYRSILNFFSFKFLSQKASVRVFLMTQSNKPYI